MFLVDTNVISAGAPALAPHDLAGWLDRNADRLYISAVTIAEIVAGISKVRRAGQRSKSAALEHWLGRLLHLYAERVLPLDLTAARIAGELTDKARASGAAAGFADVAIAATALARGLIVLTRNTKHFRPLGVTVHDPFAALPD